MSDPDALAVRRAQHGDTAGFEELGLRCTGVIESPLTGPAGNTEFLGHFVAGARL